MSTPKPAKVPGAGAQGGETTAVTPTTADNEHLPNSIDVDPKTITGPLLTRQGWIVPQAKA
jgi:hypothetical protein